MQDEASLESQSPIVFVFMYKCTIYLCVYNLLTLFQKKDTGKIKNFYSAS